MSWGELTQHIPWIGNYTKEEVLRDFRIQCRNQSCRKSYKYVECPEQFRNHIFENHPMVHITEMMHLNITEWKYYRLTKSKNLNCIFCDAQNFSSNDTLLKHVTFAHFQEDLEFHEKQDWIWKYLIPVQDFSAKCYLCENSAHIVNLNLDIPNLKKHVEEHVEELRQRIQFISRSNKYSWKYYAEKNDWMEKCFINLGENFRAQCRFCTKTLIYITSISMKNHMKKHNKIYLNEEVQRQIKNDHWLCFRYTKKQTQEEIQCIICYEIMQTINWTMEEKNRKIMNHAKEHFIHEVYQYLTAQNWSYKYMNQDGDSVICMICEESITYYCNVDRLEKHMEKVHKKDWDRIQELKQGEVHAEAGPSTSHARGKKSDQEL